MKHIKITTPTPPAAIASSATRSPPTAGTASKPVLHGEYHQMKASKSADEMIGAPTSVAIWIRPVPPSPSAS